MRPNKHKLTKRQKLLATAIRPTYGGYSTWDEVRASKLHARGSYWHDQNLCRWVAFSPGGRRIFYDDIRRGRKYNVRQCAELVAKGYIKEANDLYYSFLRDVIS
jgi:hypothetical protein